MEKKTANNKKALGALGLLALLLLIAYLTKDKWSEYFPMLGKASGGSSTPPSTGATKKVTPTSSGSSSASVDKTQTLKIGDRGKSVEALQTMINVILAQKHPNDSQLTVDGIFGAKTEAALSKIANVKSISIEALEKLVHPEKPAGRKGQTSQTTKEAEEQEEEENEAWWRTFWAGFWGIELT